MRFFIIKSKVLIFVCATFLFAFLLLIISPQTVNQAVGLNTAFAVNRYKTEEHLVSLTLEINNQPDNLSEILNILSKHNVSATFFVTGEVARQSAEMLEEIIDSGHEIGIMGFSYIDQSRITALELRNSIRATREQLEAIEIEYQYYYRPPFLKSETEMVAALSSYSFLTIEGDVVFYEEDLRSLATRVDDATENLKTGSIIRLPPIDDETDKILEELFDILEAEAKSAVKLSYLLPEEGYTITNEGIMTEEIKQ